MKHVDLAYKLTQGVQFSQNTYQGNFSPAFMNGYSREKLIKAVFAHISYLSSIDTYAFSDEELPAIYNIYDSTMTLLESLSLSEFMRYFGIDDIDKAYHDSFNFTEPRFNDKYTGITNNELYKIKLLFDKDCTYNAPMERNAMEVLSLCNHDRELSDLLCVSDTHSKSNGTYNQKAK